MNKSTTLPINFESIGLSVQEKRFKSNSNTSYQVSSQLDFPIRRIISILKMVAMVAILDFQSEQF